MSNSRFFTDLMPVVPKPRLAGLDLGRGVAAFAVVILHADEGITKQPNGWSAILSLAAFAVPFFLAASCYLTVQKLNANGKPIRWQVRFRRLLVPYGVWSVFYLCLQVLRLVAKRQGDQIPEVFADPFGLIFLGKTGFHLYFIPLLVIGTLLIMAIEPFLRRPSSLVLRLGLTIASLIVYQFYRSFLAESAPASGMGSNLLALLGYAIRCLPYIAFGLLLVHPLIQSWLSNFTATVTALTVFIVLNSIRPLLDWQAVYEPLLGVSALCFALSISHQLQSNRWIEQMGQYSFGIYLMHLAVVEIGWSLMQRLGWATHSIAMLVGMAIVGFAVSWWLTAKLMAHQRLAHILFGVAL